MLWIKRNLFLAVGGLVALMLLGGGVFYFLTAQGRKASIVQEWEQNKAEMDKLQAQKPYPSPDNIKRAKEEADKLRGAVGQLHRFFTPVPAEKVTGVAFRAYRDNTLAELQRMAEQAKTTLPGRNYAFSFETQKPRTEFREGTFPAIPEQMAEVKALCRILFGAHVDPLVNIRRARVSKDDDESSAASDYLALNIETNAETGTVSSPYELSFGCLSSDLALVLQGLAASRHGFIVKAIHVEPMAQAAANVPGGGQPIPGQLQPANPNQPRPRPLPGQAPGAAKLPTPAAVPVPGAARSGSASDRPIQLLKESRLKATLLIYVIKTAK
jgi:hypothetical protein